MSRRVDLFSEGNLELIMKKTLIVSGLCIYLLTGCSVFMAAKQPPKKDLTVLNVGTPRNVLIAELGSPVHTEKIGRAHV